MLRRGRLSVDQACSRKNHGTGRGNEGRLQIRYVRNTGMNINLKNLISKRASRTAS